MTWKASIVSVFLAILLSKNIPNFQPDMTDIKSEFSPDKSMEIEPSNDMVDQTSSTREKGSNNTTIDFS